MNKVPQSPRDHGLGVPALAVWLLLLALPACALVRLAQKAGRLIHGLLS